MKVPADKLRGVLGITDVDYKPGSSGWPSSSGRCKAGCGKS